MIYQIHDVSTRWLAKHIRRTHYQENRERTGFDSIASLAIVRKAKCRFQGNPKGC
jgi:hypothetical protein